MRAVESKAWMGRERAREGAGLMAVRAHYLDFPGERASRTVLSALGVTVQQKPQRGGQEGHAGEVLHVRDDAALAGFMRERRQTRGAIRFEVKRGAAWLDVRDAADCWVRIEVKRGQSVTVEAGRYHRLQHVLLLEAEVEEQEQEQEEDEQAQGQQQQNDEFHIAVSGQGLNEEAELRFPHAQDAAGGDVVRHETRALVCDLCAHFYTLGWVTGTGGSISIRHGDRIYMTPSGVQKERIQPDELFVLDRQGSILCAPPQKAVSTRRPKLSECAPLFLHAYQQRNAGAVLHSHSVACNVITAMLDGQSEFRIRFQEMIKGMAGTGYTDDLVIPIIENTPREHQLAHDMGETMRLYPDAWAILVRRHGIYIWGDTWEAAKRHAECIHYLFDVAIEYHKVGLDYLATPSNLPDIVREELAHKLQHQQNGTTTTTTTAATKRMKRKASAQNGHTAPETTKQDHEEEEAEQDGNGDQSGHSALSRKKRARANGTAAAAAATGGGGGGAAAGDDVGGEAVDVVLLDIEGTTTPITFVKDVLFPYAAEHAESYLRETWTDAGTQALVQGLAEAVANAEDRKAGAPLVGNDGADSTVEETVAVVQWLIARDRKEPSLKQLQGKIWRRGYDAGELQATVYDDVPRAMERWTRAGRRVCIYSSGSRQAQHLLFKHSDQGDLRPYLSAYFDTKAGPKREASSYAEIALSLGIENPGRVLFLTDILQEAQAASEAGFRATLLVRPGNAPLPPASKQPFPTVTTFDDLLL